MPAVNLALQNSKVDDLKTGIQQMSKIVPQTILYVVGVVLKIPSNANFTNLPDTYKTNTFAGIITSIIMLNLDKNIISFPLMRRDFFLPFILFPMGRSKKYTRVFRITAVNIACPCSVVRVRSHNRDLTIFFPFRRG